MCLNLGVKHNIRSEVREKHNLWYVCWSWLWCFNNDDITTYSNVHWTFGSLKWVSASFLLHIFTVFVTMIMTSNRSTTTWCCLHVYFLVALCHQHSNNSGRKYHFSSHSQSLCLFHFLFFSFIIPFNLHSFSSFPKLCSFLLFIKNLSLYQKKKDENYYCFLS